MSQRWALFFMVAVGVFLSTMDSSMINVALPELMRTFHATLPQTEWVVIIYLLTITVTLLLWGNLADRFSRGKIYLYGMLGFALGSIGCAISPTLSVLILFRFFQALGASMMMSSGPALIKVVFPEKDLGMALGMVGIATSSGLMSGPVVSGFLLEMFSWRAIFLVTLPLSLSVF
ncbi:MAG: MFS transporter, partial [Thermodesulfobacteriota bacterium]